MEQIINKKEINKKIFSMIIPITTENILQMTSGIIIMAMIGRISAEAVSAMGISNRITNLTWAVFKGVSLATTVFVAQYFGANEREKVGKTIQQSILTIVISVIMIQILILANAPTLLKFFEPSPQTLEVATQYLRIVTLGLLPWILLTTINSVLQGMGNARTPMMLTLTMNVVTIVLGYLLIFGVGVEPQGLFGAAIALIVAQTTAATIGFIILFSKKGPLHGYSWRKLLHLDKEFCMDIYRVGIPSSSEMLLWQLAGIIMTRAVLTFGETTFAAHQLGMQAESLAYMPAAGFGIATMSFVGQGLGAKDKELARAYFKSVLRIGSMMSIACTSILLLFPKFLMSLLTNDKEIILLGSYYLFVMGVIQIPQNLEKMYTGALRAAGYSKAPMFIAVAGYWGIRVPISLIVIYWFHLSIKVVWWIMAVDVFTRFVATYFTYKKIDVFENNRLNI